MLHTSRLVPNDNARRLYSVRGVVEGHDIHESGVLIFKKRIPIIRVRINENQLVVLNGIVREYHRTSNNHFNGIASVLELGMTEEETKQYPINSEIGITFGLARVVDQFFAGATPIKVMRLQIMHQQGIKIDNEVQVST